MTYGFIFGRAASKGKGVERTGSARKDERSLNAGKPNGLKTKGQRAAENAGEGRGESPFSILRNAKEVS